MVMPRGGALGWADLRGSAPCLGRRLAKVAPRALENTLSGAHWLCAW